MTLEVVKEARLAASPSVSLAGVSVEGGTFMVAHWASGFFLPALRKSTDLPVNGPGQQRVGTTILRDRLPRMGQTL